MQGRPQKRRRKTSARDSEARIERALTQRIYVLDIIETNFGFIHEIKGVTSNYTVIISNGPDRTLDTCSCQDFHIRQTPCKHILLTLHRVYGFSLPSLQDLDSCQMIPSNPRRSALGVVPLTPDEILELSQRDPTLIQEAKNRNCDNCCICFETYNERDFTTNFICKQCKNQVHLDCMAAWKSKQKTCPYCRCTV